MTYVAVPSPNAPRPAGLTLEIADMLRRIEYNYDREGSGPGSRFEGRLLEDVQAEAVLRRVWHAIGALIVTFVRPEAMGQSRARGVDAIPVTALHDLLGRPS